MSQGDGDAHVQLLNDPEEIVSKSTLRRRSSGNGSVIINVLTQKKNKVYLNSPSGHLNPTPELTTFGGIKLGWIQGVLIPCLLNIWGVMLFLRISWIVAQAGIGLTVAIIFLAGIVCFITTLSLSAICTNGELQGGGVYYLVSRSLGAELGASVGIIFAFANAVAASMNTIGFCDSLNELLRSHGLKIVDNGANDVRIVGAVALFVMCVICAVGMDWETKTQNFLITIIVLAIINFVIGACMGPLKSNDIAKGFVGLNMKTAYENWSPDFRFSEGMNHDFFSVFAMYFPAVTGVQAGANICGDLRNPAMAIPKGTFLALGISMTSYLLMAVLSGVGAMRDASGDVEHLNQTTLKACRPHCDYGLHNNYEIMQLMSAWGPLIYGGCWAATLSTALTNLLSVPRLIQALGVDRIYPGLIFFSKPYGKHGEPYRGYVLTFLVSLLFLLIADLNTIAPLITNFYLASYALINFCTFHAGLVQSISWRPTFHCYNSYLSLVGFLLCVCIMMVVGWVMALITTFVFMTLYLLVLYTKPDATWGSSTEAQRYQDTIAHILQISRTPEHVKSYNPQLLVMAGKPFSRPALLDLAHLITKKASFMIVVDVEKNEMDQIERQNLFHLGEDWLQSRRHRAFFVLLSGMSVEKGVKALVQCAGLGRLEPNIMLIGFKEKWRTCEHKLLEDYIKLIQNAIEQQLAVAILRAPASARPSCNIGGGGGGGGGVVAAPAHVTRGESQLIHSQLASLMHADSNIDTDLLDNDDDNENVSRTSNGSLQNLKQMKLSELKQSMAVYQPLSFKTHKSVDTWWLYDDGGLSILLPYIIARRGLKEKIPLRIFVLPRPGYKKEEAQTHFEKLLAKYRIDYTELIMPHEVTAAPAAATWEYFNVLSEKFKTTEPYSDILITETEFKSQFLKTCRHLRLRELLIEYSSEASLIVMSLPLPRKGLVSAAMYMAWLEALSDGLPPMLFVRGNHTSVLDA